MAKVTNAYDLPARWLFQNMLIVTMHLFSCSFVVIGNPYIFYAFPFCTFSSNYLACAEDMSKLTNVQSW